MIYDKWYNTIWYIYIYIHIWLFIHSYDFLGFGAKYSELRIDSRNNVCVYYTWLRNMSAYSAGAQFDCYLQHFTLLQKVIAWLRAKRRSFGREPCIRNALCCPPELAQVQVHWKARPKIRGRWNFGSAVVVARVKVHWRTKLSMCGRWNAACSSWSW